MASSVMAVHWCVSVHKTEVTHCKILATRERNGECVRD